MQEVSSYIVRLHRKKWGLNELLLVVVSKLPIPLEMFSQFFGIITYSKLHCFFFFSCSCKHRLVMQTQARQGGLNLLGDKDASFPLLIQSFPRILLLSLETRLKPVVEFLKDVGVPKRNLRNVVLLYPPILFHNVEKDIKPAFVKVCLFLCIGVDAVLSYLNFLKHLVVKFHSVSILCLLFFLISPMLKCLMQ